jgi:arylsulfate sulfotransferase
MLHLQPWKDSTGSGCKTPDEIHVGAGTTERLNKLKRTMSNLIRRKPRASTCLTVLDLPEALSRDRFLRHAVLFSLTLAVLGVSFCSHGITFLSGPSFIKSTNAPLAGVLLLTTDQDTRLSVLVNDGRDVWERHFYDYAKAHSVPLLGFKPGRTNEITVTAYDRQRNQVTASQPLVFITDPLPKNFPIITLLQADPAQMEPGYTLFRVDVDNGIYWYVTILDNSGEVVWYDAAPTTVDVRQLANGDLFMPWTTNFVEINMLGQTVNSWVVLANLPIDTHDGVPTDHGTILYLSDTNEVVSNYPTSMTISNPPLAIASVRYERVVEISFTNAAVLHTWSPINFLDPRRITYLIGKITGGYDSEHSNAVIEDPSDDSLIVSMRNQNAVVKFSRATGQLRWILGPHDNWGAAWQPYLLTPVGAPFGWQFGQHAPIITPQGTLILYDDGNIRASPFAPKVPDQNNYSRAVEYNINEQTMEVTQVWDYGRTNTADRLYTGRVGNAELGPKTGNVLIDFGAVSYVNGVAPSQYGPSATMARIMEVTHDAVPQVVFDVAISMYANTNTSYKDCGIYRCHRIPDLYAHPAKPVADLSVTSEDGLALLEFSADDTRTYVVEASTNLVDWEAIGVAVEDEQQSGEFSFEDDQSDGLAACYYRVVTQ